MDEPLTQYDKWKEVDHQMSQISIKMIFIWNVQNRQFYRDGDKISDCNVLGRGNGEG